MSGKLSIIGIGPGDPELVTLKASRVLAAVGHLFVPLSKKGRTSIAHAIARPHLRAGCTVEEMTVPMVRDRSVLEQHYFENFERIVGVLRGGTDAALITLGDPATYSTTWPVLKLLKLHAPDIAVDIIPGITSYADAAARAAVTLSEGNEIVSIVSAYDDRERIESMLEVSDTVVFMKTYRDREKLLDILAGKDLLDQGIYVQRSGLAGETIISDLRSLPDKAEYLSLIIVKKP